MKSLIIQENTTNDFLNHAWELKKKGYDDSTINSAVNRLKTISKICNSLEPEQVKAILATRDWKPSSKRTNVETYNRFLISTNKEWIPPRYKSEPTIPFIPTEEELNILINACKIGMSTLIQLLKETGARMSEAKKLA